MLGTPHLQFPVFSAFRSFVLRSLSTQEALLREQLSLLRTLVGRGQDEEEDDLVDFATLTTEAELQAFNEKVDKDVPHRKRLVGGY